MGPIAVGPGFRADVAYLAYLAGLPPRRMGREVLDWLTGDHPAAGCWRGGSWGRRGTPPRPARPERAGPSQAAGGAGGAA